MKTILLAGSALALATPVLAAPERPIAAPAVTSWNGCYAGGHFGAGWQKADFSDPVGTSFTPAGASFGGGRETGGLAGGQAGCDFQFSQNWVVGLAGDFSFANIESQGNDPFFGGKNGSPPTVTSRTDWMASLTGRVGYGFDNYLVYAKGGAAWAHNKYDANNFVTFNGFFCFNGVFLACNSSGSDTRSGWTLGGGIAYAASRNWSVFAEYNHYHFGTRDVQMSPGPGALTTAATPLRVRQSIDAVKIGVNYRFGG